MTSGLRCLYIKRLQSEEYAYDSFLQNDKLDILKLSEEIGELSKAIRKNLLKSQSETVKETIDKELWDVIYYYLAIANCYNIDIEQTIKEKEEINSAKYNTEIKFEENR